MSGTSCAVMGSVPWDYMVKPYDLTVLRSKVISFIKLKQSTTAAQNEIRGRRRAEALLKKTNEALEQRVLERTAELGCQPC
jgi:hypothetical protein